MEYERKKSSNAIDLDDFEFQQMLKNNQITRHKSALITSGSTTPFLSTDQINEFEPTNGRGRTKSGIPSIELIVAEKVGEEKKDDDLKWIMTHVRSEIALSPWGLALKIILLNWTKIFRPEIISE